MKAKSEIEILNETLFKNEARKIKTRFKKVNSEIIQLKAERKIYLTFDYLFQDEIRDINKKIDLLIQESNKLSKDLDILVNRFENAISVMNFENYLVLY